MVLSNHDRLKDILSKAVNHSETSLDLQKLQDNDFCGFSLYKGELSYEMCIDTDLNYDVPGFAKLPFSTANIIDGCNQYDIIERVLENIASNGAKSVEDVIDTIKQCAPWIRSHKPFDGLRRFMDSLPDSEKRQKLDTITGIAKLALRAKKGHHQASAIVTRQSSRIVDTEPGAVCVPPCSCLLLHNLDETRQLQQDKFLKLPLAAATSEGTIEDATGCLQVDFASRYIGGGAVRTGAVQEEILFMNCPEMIVSSLLCERMGPLETIHITGAQRYSSYAGYGRSPQWIPLNGHGSEPRDEFGCVITNVVAMDAKHFKPFGTPAQYTSENINRELNKAYAAFMTTCEDPRPVATGNWDAECLVAIRNSKILAAAKMGRSMIYYTFYDADFETALNGMYETLVQNNATIGTIEQALLSYGKERERNLHLSVFQHVEAVMCRNAGSCSF